MKKLSNAIKPLKVLSLGRRALKHTSLIINLNKFQSKNNNGACGFHSTIYVNGNSATTTLEQKQIPENDSKQQHPFQKLPKLYYLFLIGGSAVILANFVAIYFAKQAFDEAIQKSTLENYLEKKLLEDEEIEQLKALIKSTTGLVKVGYYQKIFYESSLLKDLTSLQGKTLSHDKSKQYELEVLINNLIDNLNNCPSDELKSKQYQSISVEDDELNQWVEKDSSGNNNSSPQTLSSNISSKFMSMSTFYKALCFTTIASLSFLRLNRMPYITQKGRVTIVSMILLYSTWVGFFRPASIDRLSGLFTSMFESTKEDKVTIRAPFVHLLFQQYLTVFSFIVWLMVYKAVKFVVLPELLLGSGVPLEFLESQQKKELSLSINVESKDGTKDQ